MTLVELVKQGFEELLGIDYSEKAVDLAREILKENNMPRVELKVCDVLDSKNFDLPANFKLAHDKGTYDAISLNPENPASKRQKYIENVYRILLPSGYLVLTSCNWTKEEIEKHFQNCKLYQINNNKLHLLLSFFSLSLTFDNQKLFTQCCTVN